MTAGVRPPPVAAHPTVTRRGTGLGGPGGHRTGNDRLGRSGSGILAAQLVVAGLAATALAQGGYHPPGRLPLLVGLPAAALLLTRTVPAGRPPVVRWAGRAAAVAGLLGAWGLLRGAVSPDPSSGVPVALLMAAVVLLLAIGRRLGPAERGLVVRGLLAVGVVVAAAGWAGVVWHLDRFAVSLDGVWRAGSTLTYPNAAAALLTLLALPAVALLATRPTDVRLVTVVCLLLVGHLATLSRAGALSLVVGLLVLTALTGWRPMVRAALAPTLGAAVAGAGLWGSFPLDAPTGRWTAVVALLAGLALAVALAPRIAPGAPVGVLGLLAVLAAAVVVAVRGAEVLSQRLAGGSSTRWDAHRAALDAVSDHPWWGAGPGAGPLDISAVVGRQFTLIRFVHDEYVQTLLDLGVLGLLLLLLLVALLVRAASVGSRDVARDPIPAGVLAALVAAAVHGGLDFVWHVPVVPLTAVTLVAVGWAGDHRPMRGNP